MSCQKFAVNFFFIMMVAISATSRAEHSVGTPGDPLRLLVAEAQDDARIILIRLKPQDLQAEDDLKSWYQNHYYELQDVMGSFQSEWVDAETAACAYAHADTKRIVFSYPTCKKSIATNEDPSCERAITGKADAVKLLFHESVHLLGFNDETFADRVALAIYRSWLSLDINRTPRWQDISPDQRPSERTGHAWTRVKTSDFDGLFVWGGCNEIAPEGATPSGVACSMFLSDGGLYNKQKDTWTSVPPVPQNLLEEPLEGQRAYASAVHVPSSDQTKLGHVYLFGGCSGSQLTCQKDYRSLLVFDLDQLTWSVIRSEQGPEARSRHQAFLTAKGLLIWGGISDPMGPGRGRSRNDGWLFGFDSKTWTQIESVGSPLPRRYHMGVYTGAGNRDAAFDHKYVVFGGCDKEVGERCPRYLSDGAVYDLEQNTWTALPPVSLSPRAKAGIAWTGESVFIWGGQNGTLNPLVDGALLSLATGDVQSNWKIVADLNSKPRYGHTLIWTGDRVISWGGMSGYNEYVSGLTEFYLPTVSSPRGVWRDIELTASPVARAEHTAVWMNDGMLVWGGLSENRSYLQSGGIYRPKVVSE